MVLSSRRDLSVPQRGSHTRLRPVESRVERLAGTQLAVHALLRCAVFEAINSHWFVSILSNSSPIVSWFMSFNYAICGSKSVLLCTARTAPRKTNRREGSHPTKLPIRSAMPKGKTPGDLDRTFKKCGWHDQEPQHLPLTSPPPATLAATASATTASHSSRSQRDKPPCSER